jgi:Cu+-exporting ATPase
MTITTIIITPATISGGGSCCSAHAKPAADAVVRDPVCGMTVDPNVGKPSVDHAGHTYHFCCEGCRTKFVEEPETYLVAIDPVRHEGRPRERKHFLRHGGEAVFLLRPLQGEV